MHGARQAIAKGARDTEILKLAKGDEAAITKEAVINAAKKQDKLAMELLENAGTDLGIRIAYMINLLNPAIVVVGGGMEKAGDLLLEPLKAAVKRFAFEEPASAVKIVPSLLGEDAIVLGAAALATREIFIKA